MMEILHITNRGRRWWASILCCFAFLFFLLLPVSVSAAGAISQGFRTNSDKITTGTLLSLSSTQGIVEPASSNNISNLVGVAGSAPLIELSSPGKNVQVVVSGLTEVLVSNVNGNIQAGDKITASPFSGIGMKATGSTEIVGIAQASLNSARTISESVIDRQGKRVSVKVGAIPIEINVAYYSANNNTASLLLPPFLQSIANTISGSEVSPGRVLASALTLILGFGTVSIMLYSSIRSSIISVGRNPLANTALRKSLIDVLIMAAGVLSITLVTMYIVVTG